MNRVFLLAIFTASSPGAGGKTGRSHTINPITQSIPCDTKERRLGTRQLFSRVIVTVLFLPLSHVRHKPYDILIVYSFIYLLLLFQDSFGKSLLLVFLCLVFFCFFFMNAIPQDPCFGTGIVGEEAYPATHCHLFLRHSIDRYSVQLTCKF